VAARVFKRLSQPACADLLFTHRYSLPIFEFLKKLQPPPTLGLANNFRQRTALPEGPDVELYNVKPESTAAKVEEIVGRWISEGFCRPEEILILSPRATIWKTSLLGRSKIGEWPLNSLVVRRRGELSLLSINKAKGLDSLAVIMIVLPKIDQLFTRARTDGLFHGSKQSSPIASHYSPRIIVGKASRLTSQRRA